MFCYCQQKVKKSLPFECTKSSLAICKREQWKHRSKAAAERGWGRADDDDDDDESSWFQCVIGGRERERERDIESEREMLPEENCEVGDGARFKVNRPWRRKMSGLLSRDDLPMTAKWGKWEQKRRHICGTSTNSIYVGFYTTSRKP